MKLSDNRPNILTIILFWWSLLVIIAPNAALSVTENMSLAGRMANVLLPLGVWGLCLTASRNIGRTVLCMFPLMFIGAFQIVLLNLYGRSVIAVDMFLNVVTTNVAEVGELLGNMALAIVLVVIMYLPPIVAAIWCVVKKVGISQAFTRRLVMPFAISALIGASGVVAAYLADSGYRAENDLFPVNAFYNIKLAAERSAKTASCSNESYNHYAFADTTHTGREVYVLIVGETSRADHWQLNGYDRATNSELADPAFISFGKTLSESNTTHKSVPMLLSHLDAESFGDSIYSIKSIISAFSQAGYRTAFFSNQRYNHSFIDRFGFEADTTYFIKEQPDAEPNPTDLALLPLLENELKSCKGPHLIVLHTYGSHFAYNDRYEGHTPKFTPDYPLQARKSHKHPLVNAYDNSICITSELIAQVASLLCSDSIPGALLYTSDHGEDIFDDYRNMFLHASPVPSVYQIHVPFVAWFNESYSAKYPENVANARINSGKDISSSQSFSQTALDMAGITTAVSDTTLSIVRRGYKKPTRIYLSDHNEAVTLKRAGMNGIDFEVLDSLGISAD
ncbi:MAG: lipid A phosphoethanolamine transferase [Muribaculaceae bacterium]|jgi:glucan phosphoethanolaminetransferase (alkaline phosphatase superfamily)|nr:lipid A phosphoethanolamine transferase [Muribaculaceae bacterium]